MPIYERLTAEDETKIPVHAFSAASRLRLSNSGGLGAAIQAGMIEAFNLTPEDQTELGAIIDAYNAIGGTGAAQAVARLEFAMRVHDTFLLCEAGVLTKQNAKTLLGF
jgi:hypothetical protein